MTEERAQNRSGPSIVQLPAEVAGASEDAESSRVAILASARDALLQTPPVLGWRSFKRKPSNRYSRLRYQLLIVLERVKENGSDRQVAAVCNAVDLMTRRPYPDLAAANALWEALRSDPGVYLDAKEWEIFDQRTQVVAIWCVMFLAAGLETVALVRGRWPDMLIYAEAMLGGLLGCFLDWNRAEPRKQVGSPLQQMFLRVF